MKRKSLNGVLLCSLLTLALAGQAHAAPTAKPWPTHAPEATPYVRVNDGSAVYVGEPEPVYDETPEDFWGRFHEKFGRFYARGEELEMFRALPQDEPYPFVPHSVRFELDEGEAMRMARLFDALDGVESRVIAQHTLIGGVHDWSYLTVVTMTPARLFALSKQMDEPFLIEQLHNGVRERFDVDYWPGALYEQTEEDLKAYEKRGCFYFEAETLEALEKLPRDKVCDFALRDYTPDGWNPSGYQLCHVLYFSGFASTLYQRKGSAECLCVVSVTPAELSVMSEKLPGRYLVKLAESDRALLDTYEVVLPFDPKGEVLDR